MSKKGLRFSDFDILAWFWAHGYFKWIDGNLEFEDSMTHKLLNQFSQESGSHII